MAATGTTSNFDLTQTLFLFNWLANSTANQVGGAQALADVAWEALAAPNNRSLLGKYGKDLYGQDWQLAWGPGVFEFGASSNKADNTAYIVYSPSQKMYVVAIAGTNPKAVLDFLNEDTFDNGMVNWEGFDPTTECMPTECMPKGGATDTSVDQITSGTAIGMWALAGQLVTPTNYLCKPTLAGYLERIKSQSDVTVVFTGHSLGGALTLAMARWFSELSDNQTKVQAMPSAAPTPGNKVFQDNWNSAFPASKISNANSGNGVTVINRNVYCNADLVPHAYEFICARQQDQNSDFYFQGNNMELSSPIANFHGAEAIVWHESANVIQHKADTHKLTQASNYKFDPQFPIQIYNKPPITGVLGDNPSRDSFLNALIGLHIWGYGSAAFNIDFSVFSSLSVDK